MSKVPEPALPKMAASADEELTASQERARAEAGEALLVGQEEEEEEDEHPPFSVHILMSRTY